ncbi:MAG TPA: hypothetical protein PKW49_06345 [Paludibacteraceae bacterium]|nr:hypothetical protein [Paludibacteraceae bacterium]HOU68184.1 hypothetical protein [Paludibacteraceae bacterium]HQJ89809.1 hypothetical protein [Paludibacteraceae bacterium]
MALTNSDKILQSVLSNPKIMELSHYQVKDDETIENVLYSEEENVIARTIAKIVKGKDDGKKEKEIYDEINNYLFKKI